MAPEQAVQSYEEVRDEATSWLRANWNPDLTCGQWWARLAGSGWGFASWPQEWYGRGIPPQMIGAVSEAYAEVGALGPPQSNGQALAAPTLITHASEEMKQRFLPALATGEEFWCQFFSEPGSGSDLASAQTRAVRDGDEWVVNGQKVWTSGAQYAQRGMLVCRTDIDVPKHRGISYFILDLDQPGVEVRPLHQMNGAHGFNEVFFTDARVSNDRLVGDLNDGWAVAITTLMFERFPFQRGVPCGPKAGLLDVRAGDVASGAVLGPMEGAQRFGEPIDVVRSALEEMDKGDDLVVRQRVMQLYQLSEMSRLTGLRSAAAMQAGRRPGPEGSARKLARSAISRQAREVGMQVLGAAGMIVGDDAASKGAVQTIALSSPSASIAGGTDEIQHNIIGERVLGLPKEPSFDRDIPFRELRVGTQRTP